MKRFLIFNMMPLILMDIFIAGVSYFDNVPDVFQVVAYYFIYAQFIIMPLYYVIILGVSHLKNKLGILKGFFIQFVILCFTAPLMLTMVDVATAFSPKKWEGTFMNVSQIKEMLELEYFAQYILPGVLIMLPGTLIIAVVSHIRRRKAEKREQ